MGRHALIETSEDDGDDVKILFVAAEDLGEPRERAAYESALRRRLDPERGVLAWLDERELLPAATAGEDAEAPGNDAAPEGILEKRLRARAALELEAAREAVRTEGVDPDEHGVPRELPTPKPGHGDLHDQMAEAQRQADEAKAQAEQEARAACAEAGVDYDAMMAKARKDAARPPRFSAAAVMEQLEDELELARNAGMVLPAVELLRDPAALRARLEQQEAMVRDLYRRAAHEGPAPDPDEEEGLRETIRAALERGESLAGHDLTGADLRGLSLAGADLRGAFLAGANLQGCDLREARLEGTVLAFARGEGAKLAGAHLEGTNLGRATLARADLGAVTGSETVLAGTDLSHARLAGASLAAPELDGADLSGAQGDGFELREATRARGVMAKGARLRMRAEQVMLTDLDAPHASFEGSAWIRSAFVDPVLDGASLARATLDRCAFAGRIAMEGADLSESVIARTSLARAHLAGSSLREAVIDGSDFSRADLRGASLYRAKARQAVLVRANLEGARATSLDAHEAILDRARLRGTDLTGAHLFAASLVRVDVDGATRLDDAVTARAQISVRKSKRGGES